MIHQPLSLDGVHPQISSSLRLLVHCLVRQDFFFILLVVYFFKRTHFFIGSLDKCHTSIFNALILGQGRLGLDDENLFLRVFLVFDINIELCC